MIGPRCPDKAAIQLNDTHPTMAVPELMRLLLDEAKLGWDEAWDLTQRTLAYTNHTLLPEALEKWPVAVVRRPPAAPARNHLRNQPPLPRRRPGPIPGDEARVSRVSLIEEGAPRQVRMAHLAIVGSHSTNGVAAMHSELLKQTRRAGFRRDVPGAIQQQDQRRHPAPLVVAGESALAKAITEAIGDGWITDLAQLEKLKPLADDKSFRDAVRKAKREAKTRFADWLKRDGRTDRRSRHDLRHADQAHPRIQAATPQRAAHRRALQSAARESELDVPPRTFFFAGKAAPAYHFAKLVIKFINNLAGTIDGDPAVQGRLKVVFVPDYRVSIAERLIPASDVSEQISTAGYEASGTSNMKFMMNGALTIGTRDGATIEMAEAAGEENFFLFGLTAEQVADSRGWYRPALALRQRAGDPRRAGPDRQQPFQPARAGRLRADPRRAAAPWRPLPAPGRPDQLRRSAPASRRALRATRRPGRARRS